jgi:hypothetical protein
MTTRQKAVFGCLQAPQAQDFLLPILIDGSDQHMSPIQYRTILKYHIMIPDEHYSKFLVQLNIIIQEN